MSKNSKVNLSSRQDPRLEEVLKSVDTCCKLLEVDFYILGALARDVWYEQGSIAAIGTKDVDFAIFFRDVNEFNTLKELLERDHGFISISDNQFALVAPNRFEIDILPFGQLEVEDGEAFDVGERKVKVNGLNQVYLESVKGVYLFDNREFKVATLPAIVMLKLIAYDDRPEHRPNDPEDCMSIIKNYYSLQSELIFEQHFDLLVDMPPDVAAPRVIGRELRSTLDQDHLLRERVITILKNHIGLREKSGFVLKMATREYYGTDEAVMYLEEILTGIEEDLVMPNEIA
jgi:predicted nucleotidyltransferase